MYNIPYLLLFLLIIKSDLQYTIIIIVSTHYKIRCLYIKRSRNKMSILLTNHSRHNITLWINTSLWIVIQTLRKYLWIRAPWIRV